MPTTLDDNAVEGSTYPVEFAFSFEPNADLTWTLIDTSGNIINSREDVSVSVVDVGDGTYTATVVLSDDDLAINIPGAVTRHVILEGTYDSTLGTGLTLVDQATFDIDDIVDVVASS